jgi:hypothetical protein
MTNYTSLTARCSGLRWTALRNLSELVSVNTWTLVLACHFIIIIIVIIIIISNLSDDRSTASSKTIPPLNAIYSFLLQMRVNLSCLQASRIHGIYVSGKRLSRKSDNVVVFSICFPHRSTTAVQNTLVTPVAIRTWTISSIICPVLQVATDDAASGISFWRLSASDAYPLTCPAREALPLATLRLV